MWSIARMLPQRRNFQKFFLSFVIFEAILVVPALKYHPDDEVYQKDVH